MSIGYLYVVQLGETGLAKIGISRDPTLRAKQWQVLSASVVYQSACLQHPRKAEKLAFQMLTNRGYAVNYEAVRAPLLEVIEVAQRAVSGSEIVPPEDAPTPRTIQSVVLSRKLIRALDRLRTKSRMTTRGEVICTAILEKAERDLKKRR